MVQFDGKYSTYTNHTTHFSKILLKNLDFGNLSQGHGVQHAQLCRSMANLYLYESHSTHSCASSHRFQDVNVANLFTLETEVKVTDYVHNGAIQCQIHDLICNDSSNVSPIIFYALFANKINCQKFDFEKGQGKKNRSYVI